MRDYPSIAAVDLGSNSFHLVVAREVDGRLQLLHKEKQRVYLAAGLDDDFNLSDEAITRALDTLAQFATTLHEFPKESVQVVATYTLRNCKNLNYFLAKAKQVFPYPINVISGQEEARLIYQGVANHEHDTHNRLVIDIGGGSTELVIGQHLTHKLLSSRNVGCVTMNKTYFADGKLSAKRFKKAEIKAEQHIESITASYLKLGWNTVIGTSGTIKAIAAMVSELTPDDEITLTKLEQIKQVFVDAEHIDKVTLKSLPEERKVSIAGGLAVLIALFRQLNIECMRFSEYALREGLLFEMHQTEEFDIRTRTINTFCDHYNVDKQHADNICETIKLFASQLKTSWSVSSYDLEMLCWAAKLHEVGLAINSSGMHKHGAYIVRHSQLPGFTQTQQSRLSALIRFYRKKIKVAELSELVEDEVDQFSRLLAVFRLSVLVNQKRQQDQLPELNLSAVDNTLTLHIASDWLESHSLFQADLEQEQQYLKTVNIQLTF
ncbi:exopolyphosphatase [Pseudoalteromonas piscicida]|uniref:Exopolyphosphatase n=1 Tax=Pseudoalteromonas piscicida TaxID=43662 RepID=A0A2A5JPT2_PSEO7|nr:exopolyphosphatase [Pseudoalteromonas piscicida]PCK31436.1 exopolyphosphatase [Pseudoalteromonas piscicida]